MPNIFEVFKRCNKDNVRYLPVHENLLEVINHKDHGTIRISVDPQTAHSMMVVSLGGKPEEAAFVVVVKADEFNKALEELKQEEKLNGRQ